MVTAQRLDTAQCKHEAAGRVDEISAHAQSPRRLRGSHQFACCDHSHAAAQIRLDQRIDHTRQRLGDRQRHVIHQRLRRGATAAFAAVDGNEVRCKLGAPAQDGVTQVVHERPAANGCFYTDRTTGQITDIGNFIEQVVDIGNIVVAVRADRILARRYAADAGDFLGDFPPRQHAALARFGSLRQFDFEGFDVFGQFFSLFCGKTAIEFTNAVLGRADLHDHIAAAGQMVWRQATLAGIHPAARLGCAARQGFDRGLRNRTEAHAADIDNGFGLEGLRTITVADQDRRRRQLVFFKDRIRVVDKNDRTRRAQIIGRTETDDAALVFCAFIDPAAGRAIERHFLAVVGKEILAKIFTQILKKETQPPDHRVIAQNGVLFLGDVVDDQEDQSADHQKTENRSQAVGHHADDVVHTHSPEQSVKIVTEL